MSHLTQWIEDAEARQYCLAWSWRYAPATPRSLRLGARVHFAAAQALSYMLRPRSNG